MNMTCRTCMHGMLIATTFQEVEVKLLDVKARRLIKPFDDNVLSRIGLTVGAYVDRKTHGLWFASATKQLLAACRATRECNTLHLSPWLASLAKKLSMASVQNAEISVKWKVKREKAGTGSIQAIVPAQPVTGSLMRLTHGR